MSEQKQENAPVSVRVQRLEQQVQALMELLPKQKEGFQSALEVVGNAAAKIVALEQRLGSVDAYLRRLDPVLEDIQIRHTALARLAVEGKEMNIENLEKNVTEVKAELLASVLTPLIDNGDIEPTDSVQRDSLVVFQETADDGTVTVPRAQYTYGALSESLTEDVAKHFLGKIPGESFKLDPNSDRNLIITQVYKSTVK